MSEEIITETQVPDIAALVEFIAKSLVDEPSEVKVAVKADEAGEETTIELSVAKDDMGKVSKVILTEEEATFKSGIMTWCGETLKKLCQTARVTEDAQKKIRTVKIGGVGNADGKRYVIHFVHKDNVDGDIRVTIVGNNQAGFTIAFAKDSETVIDAEFKAQPMDKEGTLITYQEEMDVTAASGE